MIGNLTGESFLIALSGMVIVFLMLAILCLFIPVISKCVRFFEKRRQKPEPVRPAPAAVPQADPAPAAAQQAGHGISAVPRLSYFPMAVKHNSCSVNHIL